MINYRKKTSYFDVYRDVLIPFVSIVSFFWICLWKSESLSWDSRMFLALLGAVFFNYFISYWNNRKMIKDQRFLEVKIYVLLWEIIVPMLTMVVVIFSMILENRFYDWNVFLNALNSIGIYIFPISLLVSHFIMGTIMSLNFPYKSKVLAKVFFKYILILILTTLFVFIINKFLNIQINSFLNIASNSMLILVIIMLFVVLFNLEEKKIIFIYFKKIVQKCQNF